jgi:DNA-binding winged helix-turn-helix (wHTH) protein
MSMDAAGCDFLIGPVRVDVAGRRLLLDPGAERLAADTQQVEVLICLIRAFPAIVSKDELIERVWGGRYVTDAALHKTLSNLRKLLREAHGGELIETRYRRGYQLTLAAVAVPSGVAGAEPSPQAATSTPAPDVLPAAERSAPSRWSRGAAIAAVLLTILVLAAVAYRARRDEPAVPALPPETLTLAPEVQASLRNLEQAALIQAIKDALASDPGFARQASAELRRRGVADERLRGLADKYDGIVAYRAGNFPQAEADYLRALPAFRAAGDQREEANVLNNLGVLLAETGSDPERALGMYRQALALRQAIGDIPGVLGSHRNLSNLLLESGRLDEAREAVAAYAQAADAEGAQADRVEALILSGDVQLASGEGDPRPAFESAMALAQEHGLAQSAASASQRLGRIALRMGDPAGARAAFQRALDWYRESGGTHLLDVVLYNLASAVAANGATREAVEHYQAVLAADPDGKPSTLRVDTRIALARLHWLLDQAALAEREIDHAATEALALQSDAALAAVAIARADFALRNGEWIAARGLLTDARQRLADTTQWELDAQWRQLDIWVRIAQGQLQSAADEIERLAADAARHGDTRVAAQLLPTRMALAGARAEWAESYRWQLQIGQSPGVALAPEQPQARAGGSPWWGLGVGVLIGLLLGQRVRASKPSA